MNVRTGICLLALAAAAGRVAAADSEQSPVLTDKVRVIEVGAAPEAEATPDARRLPDAVPPPADANSAQLAVRDDGISVRPRLWVEAGALGWWVKNGPLQFPLITTGNPLDGPTAGALGQPGTRALFGGTGLDYGHQSGLRISAGGWLPGESVGAEVNAFRLQTGTINVGFSSNAVGVPGLYLPSVNVITGTEGRLVIADQALGFAGSAAARSTSVLGGVDANALFAVAGGPVAIDLLAGFRYADLREALTVGTNSLDLILLTQTSTFDQLAAVNRFYGGQVGVRAAAAYHAFTFGATAKLAVGWTHEAVTAGGATVQSSTAPLVPTGTFAGGFFTQPTNTGRREANDFSAIPELGLRVGWQLLDCLKVYAGYDLLYWTRVVRPGGQIDRFTNPTQSPVFGLGNLMGEPRPLPLLSTSTFFAQGFTAGVELRY